MGWIGSIFGLKTAGVAGYFEDKVNENRINKGGKSAFDININRQESMTDLIPDDSFIRSTFRTHANYSRTIRESIRKKRYFTSSDRFKSVFDELYTAGPS